MLQNTMPPPRNVSRAGILAALAVTFLLAVLLVALRLFSQVTAPPDPAPLVTVITAGAQLLPRTLICAGTIEPVAEVDLGAREAGTLTSVNVRIGAHVRAGEVLASLDTGQLAADAAAAQAQLQVAQANDDASARAYDRVADIRNSGAIAPEQVDQRGADALAQHAQVSVAEANLAAAQARLAAAVLTAPMDGTITARNAEPGQYAAPGGPPLFSLMGDQGVIYRASLPQDQLALVEPGMKVRLALPAGAALGHVIGIDPAIDAATHLGVIRVALDGRQAPLPGAFVEANIDLGGVIALALPQSALIGGDDGFHVVVLRGGQAHLQPVTLADLPGSVSGSVSGSGSGNGSGNGAASASALAPIAGGVKTGDQVVLYAGASLREGQPVRPAPAPAFGH